MRKMILIAAGVAVLATAGLATARTLGPAKSDEVTGTFTATNATKVTTRTCQTADGRTITVTMGTYTGTATGDADVTGPVSISARAVVDSTAGVGFVSGRLHIDVAGRDTNAALTAVVDGNKLAGMIGGGAHNPSVRLLGNVSADFTGATGFANGKIGNSAGGSAVELGPTKCTRAHGTKEESSARGTVSALSDTSITVAGLTCSIPADMKSKVNDALDVGDRASIKCKVDGGANTLTAFKKGK